MTDMDAAECLKELAVYNQKGMLITTQNEGPTSVWFCALDHAIRALVERLGYKMSDISFGQVENSGAFVAVVDK